MNLISRVAGVELGGTKSIAVLALGGRIVARHQVPTGGPGETLGALGDWLATQTPFAALGIASFGPISLDPSAPDFGCVRTTSKPGWSGTAVRAAFATRFDGPIAIGTDVNAAALAEHRWGAGQGADNLAYITIGTGVGVGLLVDGRPLHGRLHPEAGHVRLARLSGDLFGGGCAFHGDCIEGLISGPALRARFGTSPETLAADDPRWRVVAHDLAQLLAMLLLTVAPQRILVGGGVGLGAPHLLASALEQLPVLLGGYLPDLDSPALAALVTSCGLGSEAGPLGAIALAHDVLREC